MPNPERDSRYMRLALRFAARGAGRVSPNPMVGALVVQGEAVVGRGYHRRAGGPHAEVDALKGAGAAAAGGTLYVNLEPCNHQGRTPPCTEAIIRAKIARVVVGMIDPNPLVDGRGVARLRAAGIDVDCGVEEAACRALNEAFCFSVAHGRPLVTLKSALTLDGRSATRTGHSRWITGEAARHLGHQLRARNDGILVGVGTVLADDPELTCRGVRGGTDPLRIVVDSALRSSPAARLVQLARPGGSQAGTVIFASVEAPPERREALEAAGVEVVTVAAGEGGLDLAAVLDALGRRGLRSLLVEGGAALAGTLWRRRLVDRLATFIAPKVLGDPQAVPMLLGGAVETMAGAAVLQDMALRRAGDDLLLTGAVRWPEEA